MILPIHIKFNNIFMLMTPKFIYLTQTSPSKSWAHISSSTCQHHLVLHRHLISLNSPIEFFFVLVHLFSSLCFWKMESFQLLKPVTEASSLLPFLFAHSLQSNKNDLLRVYIELYHRHHFKPSLDYQCIQNNIQIPSRDP